MNKKKQKFSSNESNVHIPIPPDGGYGWVIVFSSFFINALVDGIANSFGVMLPYLLEHFHEGRAKTSLAGSLMITAFLISGPIVGALVNIFGCRVITISGGIICSFAIYLSSLSPNLNTFILLYGVVAGFGIGMFFLPGMVTVGYYFETKRAIATGVTCSGAGAGIFLIAPIVAFSIEYFGFTNMFIILSGIALQAVVLGALLRPIESHKSITCQSIEDINDKYIYRLRTYSDAQLRSRSDGKQFMKYISRHSFSEKHGRNSTLSHEGDTHDFNIDKDHSRNIVMNSAIDISSKSQSNPMSMFYSHRELINRKSSQTLSSEQKLEIIHQLQEPLNRMDIFFQGSVLALPEYKKESDVTSYLKSNTHINADTAMSTSKFQYFTKNFYNSIKNLAGLSILGNKEFLLIGTASLFMQLGYSIPLIYMSDYASNFNISYTESSYILSAFGVSNGVGRLVSGMLSNMSCVNALLLNDISLLIIGIASIVITFTSSTFVVLTIYSIIYGLFLATPVIVTQLLLIKYLGLLKLTNAFGLLCLIKGIGSLTGPPLAGAVLDLTNSYQIVFCLAGVFHIISCFFYHMLVFLKDKSDEVFPMGNPSSVPDNEC